MNQPNSADGPINRRFHRSLHQVPRYAPVLQLLSGSPRKYRILEIGSGDEGIGTWWRRPFVGVDLDFQYRRVPNLSPVVGDATRLPFASGSFDLVICVGVLTVLQGSLETTLSEIARVTGGRAIIVTPCGPQAQASDRRNDEWSRRHGITPPRWFSDQLRRGLPSRDAIAECLARFGAVREGTTVAVPWNERLFRIEQRLRQARGAMTAVQPLIRVWGKMSPRRLASRGEPYERWFLLDTQATSSPPD